MRKHLKRAISMLLAVVMVLALLPTFAFAASEEFVITPIQGVPEEGTAFVIYAPAGGVVMGAEANSGKTPGYAVAGNEENADLKIGRGAGLYKLVKNSDGTYCLTCGGKYYTATSTSTAKYADAPEKGSKWNIEVLGAGYKIANTDYFYNANPACLEVYGGAFSPYGYSDTSADIYTMQFYAVDEATADPDGNGYIGTKPESGSKPADGSKIVIYNDNAKACFGALDGASLAIAESTLTADGIEAGNGALIFDVHFDGTYYTFENNGKYLATDDTEAMFFYETEGDYTKWTLEEVEGGYIIYNKSAKYSGKPVCIEYFSNAFSGWTYNGSPSLFAMRFFEVEDPLGLGYVLNPKMELKTGSAYVGVDYTFTAVLDDLSEVTQMTMTYALDGGAAVELAVGAVDGLSYTYVIPGASLEGKTSLTLTGSAKNAYGMEYTASKTVEIVDAPRIVSVAPIANASTGVDKRPVITVNIANCGENPTVELAVDDETVTPTVNGNVVTWQSETDMADGRHTVRAAVTRADGKVAEMVWSFFVGEGGMALYYGQLHSHTNYSDGAGSLAEAYEYASQADDIDFLAVTDHSNYFDTTSTAKMESYYDLSSLTKAANGTVSKWEEAKQIAAQYNTNSFVAIYGYEMTWSGGPGHTNTFNTYGTVSRNNGTLNNKADGYAGMHLYNDLMYNADRGLDVDGNPVAEGVKTKHIEEAPVVSQFNHPGTTFGNFDDFAGYTPSRDAVLNLVEVGNGEGLVGGSSYWPSYSEYDLALSKGWHIAPTNNQDNHKGRWGDSNTTRNVVLTDNFSEAGIYEALSARRVYATEDQNLQLYYTLNGQYLGTIIDTADEEVETVHINVSLADPDGEVLGTVEVIGENGLSLYSETAVGATHEMDVELPNTDAYYYIKLTQADGDIAVTAPVWLGLATPISATIDSDAALPVVGGTETITTTVTNSAALDYTLTKAVLTLQVGGTETVVKTINTSAVVAAGKSKTFVFDYKRTAEGSQILKITFYGIYNGESFKCQANMTHKVYSAEKLVSVAVDRGHDNYYISGNYADSALNFISFCADNGVMCEYLGAGEFTYENLSRYKLVVLTVPYLRTSGKANMYTEEEIAALKQYTDNGGSVIICSKSDRDNPYDNCADNSNALLAAIGAHSRVVNGIIVDNQQKANEAYRVYFSGLENFNTEHRFTKGAYTSSNAFGTTPEPTNQTGFQVYNGAPIEILEGYEETVEVLINGYQTTWGSHYDGYFDGAAFVPEYTDEGAVSVEMGDVNVMTYEELASGGWVVTSGVTFFSDYDIKDDQDYANKFILRNILRDLTGADEEPVTPIVEVKAVPEAESGKEFTIEGYVTSNASDYDTDTAFFDCIYVQDKEGNGINVFPVSGNYCIGMNVQCHGAVTYYCGEVELNLAPQYNGSIRIVSDELCELEPAEVTCEVAMSDAAIGNLMQVEGVVTEIQKTGEVIDKIYVTDETGTACIFINGYIMKDYTGLNELKVGHIVSAVGIGSRDVDETSAEGAIFARLRVRDRSEIVILGEGEIPQPPVVDPDPPVIDPPVPTVNFTDVLEEHWFYEDVMFMAENGYMSGVGNEKFDPNGKLTRGMLVTVLYRIAGAPSVEGLENPFTDLKDGAWYYDAVVWAANNGVVSGVTETTFKPDDNITREQIAAILYRYVGAEPVAEDHLAGFPDADEISAYAKDAMNWAVANGVINGNQTANGTVLEAKGTATRAQAAAILARYFS